MRGMTWAEAQEVARRKQADKIMGRVLKRQSRAEVLHYEAHGATERDLLLNYGWQLESTVPIMYAGSSLYNHYMMTIQNPQLKAISVAP